MAIPFLQIHDVHQIDHMNCEFFPVVEEKELIDCVEWEVPVVPSCETYNSNGDSIKNRTRIRKFCSNKLNSQNQLS